MIIAEIDQYQRYAKIPELALVLKEISSSYQSGIFPKASRELTKDTKLNSVSFTSRVATELVEFENHRQWLDIHFIFSGSEKILLGNVTNMKCSQPYELENDIEFFTGQPEVSITLAAGQFLVCYPGEAHCVGLSANSFKPQHIDKLVGKIRIKS